jgi:DNA-binding response OmpR family regulator
MPRVLILEERTVAESLRAALGREGIADVSIAETAREGLATAAERPFDLAIMDVDLPDISGFETAVALRQRTPEIAILFLTERTGLADKLMGFGVGCDDFVTIPFETPEVVARARALLRRATPRPAGERYDFGHFTLIPDQGRLLVDGRDVAIPARELQLLRFLAANPETVHPWREIYRAVWGEDPVGQADRNTVSVHVYRLRNRIEPDPAQPRYLLSVHGLGYRLVDADASAALVGAGSGGQRGHRT